MSRRCFAELHERAELLLVEELIAGRVVRELRVLETEGDEVVGEAVAVVQHSGDVDDLPLALLLAVRAPVGHVQDGVGRRRAFGAGHSHAWRSDAHRPARRPRDARNQLQERRLSRAVAADDAQPGAGLDLERRIAQRPDRRVDLAARRAVHLVGLPAPAVHAAGDKVDDRTRPPGAVALGHVLELDGG